MFHFPPTKNLSISRKLTPPFDLSRTNPTLPSHLPCPSLNTANNAMGTFCYNNIFFFHSEAEKHVCHLAYCVMICVLGIRLIGRNVIWLFLESRCLPYQWHFLLLGCFNVLLSLVKTPSHDKAFWKFVLIKSPPKFQGGAFRRHTSKNVSIYSIKIWRQFFILITFSQTFKANGTCLTNRTLNMSFPTKSCWKGWKAWKLVLFVANDLTKCLLTIVVTFTSQPVLPTVSKL